MRGRTRECQDGWRKELMEIGGRKVKEMDLDRGLFCKLIV